VDPGKRRAVASAGSRLLLSTPVRKFDVDDYRHRDHKTDKRILNIGWRFRKSIRLAKGVRLNLESGKKRGQPNRINGMREARFSRQVFGNVDICCCHHSRLCENFVSQQVKILYFISSIQALRRGTVSLRMLSRWVLPDTKERYKREWKMH
jgi:hypothetical protein